MFSSPICTHFRQHYHCMNDRNQCFSQTSKFSSIKVLAKGSKRDFGIIGAGAAGMASAIHARYDGFSVAVFDGRNLGGGAYFKTPLIHNIPGHPTGISGITLSQNAIQQFEKLGGNFYSGTTIKKISKESSDFKLIDNKNQSHIVSKIILSIGVAYRQLNIPGSTKFDGKGLYYEVVESCIEELNQNRSSICIYGAGNSAGQAALFYESIGARVTLIHHGSHLETNMSQYLVQRISRLNIKVIPNTTITELEGHDFLQSITAKNLQSNLQIKIRTHYLFAMIGGIPATIPKLDFDKIALDHRGYILVKGYTTGQLSLATSVLNIYAAGDITSIGAGRILLAQAQGVLAFIEASRQVKINNPMK